MNELRIPITKLAANTYDTDRKAQPVTVPTTGFVVVAKDSNVYGTCGGDGKTLTELTIQADEKITPIRFVEK